MPASMRFCRALLVMAALLLCSTALTPSSYYVSAAVPMECALSGSSFYWDTLLSYALGTPVGTGLLNAMQTDLQNAAGSAVTVTIGTPFANTSALIVEYTYSVNPGQTVTVAEVAAAVEGKSFPQTQSQIDTLQAHAAGTPLAGLSDFVPTDLKSIRALYEDPSASSTTALTYTVNVTYGISMLLTGSPTKWKQVMASDSTNIESKLTSSINTYTSSRRTVCTSTVLTASVVEVDPSFKSIGDGSGGLYVLVSNNCYGTTWMSGRFLTSQEVASAVSLTSMMDVTAEYQSASGSFETIAVELTRPALKSGSTFVLDSGAKGMIAMAAAITALCLIAVVVTLISTCCPCLCLRVERDGFSIESPVDVSPEDEMAPTTMAKKAAVPQKGVEVRRSEPVAAGPDTPTTVARGVHRSNEPVF